ncbi:CD63 antigen-like [Bacillus rossius redtenbacheri]|uniref:CD63 antigen-like n=1 Tax=Bacillus rossius redtenbacheri TaxID=93214 RepID=UPI002FDD9F5E
MIRLEMAAHEMGGRPVDLNKGMRCIKYLLFSFNFVFMLTGMLVIAVGTTILAAYQKFDSFLESSFYSPATLLMAVGVVIGVVAFFGCLGAARESTCMIMVFSVLLGVVFVLEVSAGIAAYVLQDNLGAALGARMQTLMGQYRSDSGVRHTFDFVQRQLHCCGVHHLQNWSSVLQEGDPGTLQFGGTAVPTSCCARDQPPPPPYNGTAAAAACHMVYGNGCLGRVQLMLSQSAIMLASAAFTLALLQLLGVAFACSLGRSIREQKTYRERRRWELREKLMNSYTPLGQTDPKITYPVIFMKNDKASDC